jgi:hypothetical protein
MKTPLAPPCRAGASLPESAARLDTIRRICLLAIPVDLQS